MISSLLTSCVPEDILNSLTKKYTVTFDSDGGTPVPSQEIASGGKVTRPDDPSKEGYTFEGWYYDNEIWSFIGYVVTEDITLTARWKQVKTEDGNTPENPTPDDDITPDTPNDTDDNNQNRPDDSDDNIQQTPDDDLSTAIPEYDGSSVTITFYHTMGAALRSILDAAIADFNEAYPNITVVHQNVGDYDELCRRITAELAIGEQPNLAYCYADHVALYNVSGAVVPLDELISSPSVGFTNAEIDDFIEGFYEEGRAFGDGKMYSLPLSKSTEVLYYNKTFFKSYGLDVPTTWEEMEQVCRTIKEIDPYSTPLAYDSEANWFITMCEQYASPYTSATEDHFLFDNDTNRAFVKTFSEWYRDGLVTTQGLSGTYSSNLLTGTSEYGTRCYMSIGSTAGASYYKTSSFEIGVTSIPQVDPTNPKVISQGPSICIFKQKASQEVAATWLLAKFLTTDVTFQASFSMQSGYTPVIKSVQENPVYAEFLSRSSEYIQAHALKVALEQSAAYFASPAFNGSAVAREEVGLLMQGCFIAVTNDLEEMIKKAFEAAVSNCNNLI